MVLALRQATRRQIVTLGALAAVLAGTCLMVNLGRPSEETVIVRWAAKHVGPAFVWLCLLLAAAWHVLWSRTESTRRVLIAEVTLVGVGIYWGAQAAFGHLGMAVAFPPFGYPAEIRDAIDRRAAIKDIAENVMQPLALAAGPSGMVAPTLDGPFLARLCPGLFEYNLATYTPFFHSFAPRITLVRNAAMHPWQAPGVTTVPSLRSAVSSEFMDLLRRNSAVRAYYLAQVPLRSTVRPARTTTQIPPDQQENGHLIALEVDGKAEISSDVSFELWLRREAFDPESAPILTLAIDRLDPVSSREFTVTAMFTTELTGGSGSGSITLSARSDQVTETDLRQLYAFALSHRIQDLRLVFTAPGKYRLRTAILSPYAP
jgi:hypothetical protein